MQKDAPINLTRKKDENIDLRVNLRQMQEKILTLKEKSGLTFNNGEALFFSKIKML